MTNLESRARDDPDISGELISSLNFNKISQGDKFSVHSVSFTVTDNCSSLGDHLFETVHDSRRFSFLGRGGGKLEGSRPDTFKLISTIFGRHQNQAELKTRSRRVIQNFISRKVISSPQNFITTPQFPTFAFQLPDSRRRFR